MGKDLILTAWEFLSFKDDSLFLIKNVICFVNFSPKSVQAAYGCSVYLKVFCTSSYREQMSLAIPHSIPIIIQMHI